MKNLKKLMALVIACAMILGTMSIAAIAADGDAAYDSKLVITGLDQGDVVNFYQVIGWEQAGVQNPVLPNGGWIYVDEFIPLSNSTYNYIIDQETGIQVSSTMAGDIAALVDTTSANATATADANGKVEVTSPAPGMYVALITPKNVDVVYNPVIVSADFILDNASASWEIGLSTATYSDTAAAKKSKLEIKKSASTVEGLSDDELAETTAIGDTVSFTVNTTIPGYGKVYDDPKFIMKDSLTDLALQTDTLTVVGLTENVDYTVVSADASGYTISFTKTYLQSLTVPTPITVTYDALVTTTALKNINEEKNEVEIDYSHNPNKQSDLKAQKDTTEHYTFSIDAANLGDSFSQIGKSGSEIIKIGRDAQGNIITSTTTWSQISPANGQQSPLAGAHFKLYRDAACTEEYQPKNPDGSNAEKLDIVSDADGRLKIEGLDAGKYWLKETQAPSGFIKAQEAVMFEIVATIVDTPVTEYYKYQGGTIVWADENTTIDNTWTEFTYTTPILTKYQVFVDGEEAATHTFVNKSNSNGIIWESSKAVELPSSIVNKRGVELPSTGGMGTTLFYAIGAILVIGAGILLVTKRRMSVN